MVAAAGCGYCVCPCGCGAPEAVRNERISTAPGCVDRDLVPFVGLSCAEYLPPFAQTPGLGCFADLAPVSAFFLLPKFGTLADYCSVTCETCQEHLLGTPFGTGIYAWVFLDYRITSNVSLTPILTLDNFAVDLGVAINRVPGYSPVPGADLMKKYNVSAQIVADYSVVVELPCTDDDIEADPVRRSGMGCYDGVDALHRAGMHCDEPIPPLWHWQVRIALASEALSGGVLYYP